MNLSLTATREAVYIPDALPDIKMIQDDCVGAVLARIIKDEEYHIMLLRNLLEDL